MVCTRASGPGDRNEHKLSLPVEHFQRESAARIPSSGRTGPHGRLEPGLHACLIVRELARTKVRAQAPPRHASEPGVLFVIRAPQVAASAGNLVQIHTLRNLADGEPLGVRTPSGGSSSRHGAAGRWGKPPSTIPSMQKTVQPGPVHGSHPISWHQPAAHPSAAVRRASRRPETFSRCPRLAPAGWNAHSYTPPASANLVPQSRPAYVRACPPMSARLAIRCELSAYVRTCPAMPGQRCCSLRPPEP